MVTVIGNGHSEPRSNTERSHSANTVENVSGR